MDNNFKIGFYVFIEDQRSCIKILFYIIILLIVVFLSVIFYSFNLINKNNDRIMNNISKLNYSKNINKNKEHFLENEHVDNNGANNKTLINDNKLTNNIESIIPSKYSNNYNDKNINFSNSDYFMRDYYYNYDNNLISKNF